MKELAPFLLQGLFMTVDEFYCHQRRILRRWERWGHPIDTFMFGLCLAFLLAVPPSEYAFWIYGVLSVVSCVVISKDEWQHVELCSGFENWLHAVLFIIHPVVLIWAGFLWWTSHPSVGTVLTMTCTMTFLFMLYQIIYWNVWRHDQQ
jgi:Na+-transporting NADH:ubiquinone oxidoreductase subunit NqrB